MNSSPATLGVKELLDAHNERPYLRLSRSRAVYYARQRALEEAYRAAVRADRLAAAQAAQTKTSPFPAWLPFAERVWKLVF